MRISDWSSDVCSSDLDSRSRSSPPVPRAALDALLGDAASGNPIRRAMWLDELDRRLSPLLPPSLAAHARLANVDGDRLVYLVDSPVWHARLRLASNELRSEEHTSELQSLMRDSSAVFCLKQKNTQKC